MCIHCYFIINLYVAIKLLLLWFFLLFIVFTIIINALKITFIKVSIYNFKLLKL